MNQRLTNLACTFLAVLFVAAMSAQAYGVGNQLSSNEDCCCHTEPACGDDAALSDTDDSCCPEPGEEDEECPCSCACSTCGVMSRTVNLFSVDAAIAPRLDREKQLFTLMPDTLPASATLGVDIQPPIA